VHVVGLDVVEQALVVGDDDHRALRAAQRVDAVGDDAQGVDVEARVGLVEDRQLRLEQAIWKISLRFFSPPEKPKLTGA
jgi:hypothetical protein